MNSRTRTDASASCFVLAERTEPLVVVADPPGGPISHGLPGCLASSARSRCPNSGSSRRAAKIALARYAAYQLSFWYWLVQPAVIRLTSKLQNPARYHHRDPLGGQLSDERVGPFPGRFDCEQYAGARCT